MTEFVVSAKLVADASAFKTGIAAGTASVEGLGKAAIGATRETRVLNTAEKELAATSTGSLSRAFQEVAKAARAQQSALALSAKAARDKQYAMRQLGVQLGDVSQQLSMGVNPAVVFGQQIGQIGLAAQGAGGKLGAFGTFISGPWGAIITGAVTVLGLMAASFLRAGEESDKSKKAIDFHKMSTDELIKSIKEQTDALNKQTQTSQQAEIATYKAGEAALASAIKRRKDAKAAVEQALAQEQLALSLARSGGGDSGAGALLVDSLQRQGELKVLLAELDKGIADAEQNLRVAGGAIGERRVAESLDAATAAAGRYERTLGRLRDELKKGAIAQAEFDAKLKAAAQKRDAEVAAARKADREGGTRSISLLAPVGGPVSSGFGARSRPTNGASTYHPAIDYAVGVGTPVKAGADGVVIHAGNLRGFGQAVIIDYGNKVIAQFGHLSEALVSRGDVVSRGQIIAKTGNTGITTGPHLDYRVKVNGAYVDPRGRKFRVGDGTGDALGDFEAAAAREAAKAADQLDQDLVSVTKSFDAAKAAADEYADALAKIDRLQKAGKLDAGSALNLRQQAQNALFEAETRQAEAAQKAFESRLSDGLRDVWDKPLVDIGQVATDQLEKAGRAGGEAFRLSGIDAAQAIAQIFGGKIGKTLGPIFGLLSGAQSGNFNSVGGPLGGILTLLNGGSGGNQSAFGKEFSAGIKKGLEGFTRNVDSVLGKLGTSTAQLSAALPYVGVALAAGSAVGSLLGNNQRKGGSGLLGAIAPIPMALFGKALKGSATISSVDDKAIVSGNSRSREAAARGLAGNVQGAIQQIADALGGTIGAFSGSIGVRKKTFVVDPSGQGRTKGAGVLKFKDEAEAQSALLRDAIADGAVAGLSDAVRRALGSSANIDKAVKEALQVDEAQTLLGGLGATMGKQFKEFERQAAERVRIARQYGFDVLKIEKINADDRTKLVEQMLGNRIGSLKDLLADIDFGDLFEGSLADQRDKLLGEIGKVQIDAEAGLDGAADKLAGLNRNLLELSRNAFGTAGGEFASDRASAISSAERVIQLENERIKAAQDAVKETNAQLNEANDLAAEQNAILRNIYTALGGVLGGGGGGSPELSLVGRQTGLL